jgi:Na+-translocating ferredoxin:NAD+ oxidoreductase subunit A
MNSAQFTSIAISAIFVQNLVMVYMLCDTSYFSALKSPVSGFLYGAIVTAATTVASMLAWLVNSFLLRPFSLAWLSPFLFILIIVALELFAELILSTVAPGYKKALHRLLQASAFNCAVLGLVFLNIQVNMRGFLGATFYGFCAGIGYLLALFIAASALERVRFSSPPRSFKGLPIALVTAGLLSLAFMGFSGISIAF